MKSNLFLLFIIISGIVNAQSQIEIKDTWVRPAAKQANSAMYFKIFNNSNIPDTLISAKSKSADLTQIHETFKRENNQMGMRELKFIAIPAKSVIELKPGGFHIMLLDMKKDYKIGDFVKTTLQFKKAGTVKFNSVVKDMR